MTTVTNIRLNNPLGVKEKQLNEIGKKSHYYTMPGYRTKDSLCTQCRYPRVSEVHI